MFAYSSNLRLKTKHEFEKVKKARKKFYSTAFCLNVCNNELTTPRLGLIIAKKQIKKAVDRNYIKRVVRESFRLQQHQLPLFDIIVIAQKQCLVMNHSELQDCLNQLWQKLVSFQVKSS